MITCPQVVYKFHSKAEEKIYKQFQQFEADGWVIHSLNLPEHQYKQWAEADFVVLTSSGLLVLEVKGGGVRCSGGVWVYTDRFGVDHHKRESPFDQAKSARFSLEKRLETKVSSSLLRKINFGFGVMFPDVIFNTKSVEWDEELIFDGVSYDRRKLDVWLDKLFKYWEKKTGRRNKLDDEELSLLLKALRPEFDRVPALISRVGSTVDELIRLTEDQYRYLDGLLIQPRVLVQGGAGTGKTFLAIEACRRLSKSGKDVLYLCRSPLLAWSIRDTLNVSMVEVVDFDSLMEKLQRQTMPKFDVLIIDEGQDFMDMESILTVDSLFPAGLDQGNWLCFMDSNNQGSIYEKMDPDAFKFLASAGIPWPLRENCRNTRQIAAETLLLTGGDIGNTKVKGDGLKVERYFYKSESDGVTAIENQLSQWIEVEQVLPGDISVLSFKDWDSSIIQKVDRNLRRRFQILDCTGGSQWHQSSLTFSSIVDFKGLENRYIVLIDFEGFEGSKSDISKLYVGMTRANAVVSWIAPASIRKMFDGYKISNMKALEDHMRDAS